MTGRETKKPYDRVKAAAHIGRGVGGMRRLWAVGGIVSVLLLFMMPDRTADGVRTGLELCVQSVIPALFPFLVLSPMLVCSLQSVSAYLCRGRSDRQRAALRASFAVGMTAGFPIGAVTLVSLYRQGVLSKSDAERCLGFCTGASPAFLCGYFGRTLWGSTACGFFLWVLQCAVCFAGMLPCMLGASSEPSAHAAAEEQPMPRLSECLREAVGRMAIICGAVVFFSVIRALLACGLPQMAAAVSGGLSEMTGGLREYAALYEGGVFGLHAALTLSAAMIGFGGVCVGMQTADAAISAGLSMRRYWLQRAVIGAVMALVTGLCCKICG